MTFLLTFHITERYGQCGLLNCDKFSKGLIFRAHIPARVERSFGRLFGVALMPDSNGYWKLMFCKLFARAQIHKWFDFSAIFNQSVFSNFTFVRSDWRISIGEHSNAEKNPTIQFWQGNEHYLFINSLLWCFATQIESSTRKPFFFSFYLIHSRVRCNFEGKKKQKPPIQ